MQKSSDYIFTFAIASLHLDGEARVTIAADVPTNCVDTVLGIGVALVDISRTLIYI